MDLLRSPRSLAFFWQFISDLVAHGKEHKKECHKMVA